MRLTPPSLRFYQSLPILLCLFLFTFALPNSRCFSSCAFFHRLNCSRDSTSTGKSDQSDSSPGAFLWMSRRAPNVNKQETLTCFSCLFSRFHARYLPFSFNGALAVFPIALLCQMECSCLTAYPIFSRQVSGTSAELWFGAPGWSFLRAERAHTREGERVKRTVIWYENDLSKTCWRDLLP